MSLRLALDDWGFADWTGVHYFIFVVAAAAGILFLVIPLHESIHYLVARAFGVRPNLHIGFGWGYVVARPPTPFATLCIGAAPMILEAFLGSLLLRRGADRAGAVTLGLGLAFAFNCAGSLLNVGASDFWSLWALGFGPLVLEVVTLALLLGLAVAEAASRLPGPQAGLKGKGRSPSPGSPPDGARGSLKRREADALLPDGAKK